MTTWTAPAVEIAAHYSPAYPVFEHRRGGWDEAIASLTATQSDRKRLAELEADLLRNGQQEPVWVHPGGCNPLDEECTGTCCPPVVLNGMHRMVNALMAGRDITVSTDYPKTSDRPLHVTRVIADTDIDLIDGIFDHLSFRAGDLWVNTGMMSSSPEGVEVYWDVDITGYEDKVEARLRSVLREAGVEEATIHTFIDYFDDEE